METHETVCHERHAQVGASSPPVVQAAGGTHDALQPPRARLALSSEESPGKVDVVCPGDDEGGNSQAPGGGGAEPLHGTPKSVNTSFTQRVKNARKSFTSPRRLVLAAGTVLAICAGIVDVVAWLKLGSFVSHVSGNVAHIGMRVEGNHAGRDSPADLRNSVLLVIFFLLGSMLCGLLIARNEVHFGKELYGLALLGNSLLLLLGMGLSGSEASAYCLAAACGLQNGMCTMHFGAVCRTTHVTGIVTDAGTTIGRILAILLRRRCLGRRLDLLDVAEVEVDLQKLKVYSLLGFGFLIGAGSGAWLARWFGVYALIVPATITGTGGGAYLFFRARLKRAVLGLEQRQLRADIDEVEHILERTRDYLKDVREHSRPQIGGESAEADSVSTTAAVVDLDGQMSHVLEVMHSLEAGIERLYHERHVGEASGSESRRHHGYFSGRDHGDAPGRCHSSPDAGREKALPEALHSGEHTAPAFARYASPAPPALLLRPLSHGAAAGPADPKGGPAHQAAAAGHAAV